MNVDKLCLSFDLISDEKVPRLISIFHIMCYYQDVRNNIYSVTARFTLTLQYNWLRKNNHDSTENFHDKNLLAVKRCHTHYLFLVFSFVWSLLKELNERFFPWKGG